MKAKLQMLETNLDLIQYTKQLQYLIIVDGKPKKKNFCSGDSSGGMLQAIFTVVYNKIVFFKKHNSTL